MIYIHVNCADRLFTLQICCNKHSETMATSVLSRKKGVIVGDDVLKVGPIRPQPPTTVKLDRTSH